VSGKKTNPRRRPATAADCKREYLRGCGAGVSLSRAIILTVLLDKFNAADYIPEIWAVLKLSQEVMEGRVSVADLERVLAEEYGIDTSK
jgi:hypothetical protein